MAIRPGAAGGPFFGVVQNLVSHHASGITVRPTCTGTKLFCTGTKSAAARRFCQNAAPDSQHGGPETRVLNLLHYSRRSQHVDCTLDFVALPLGQTGEPDSGAKGRYPESKKYSEDQIGIESINLFLGPRNSFWAPESRGTAARSSRVVLNTFSKSFSSTYCSRRRGLTPCSEKGVRLALKKMQVGPCTPVRIQLQLYKGLKWAQLLGQLGVFLTRNAPWAASPTPP